MSNIKLSIAKPCSEKWDNFQKYGNEGFCSSCQKNVIDFTKYSDEQIVEYFRKHGSQKTCGRLRNSQLKTYDLPKKKRDFRAIAALFTAGVLTVLNPSESNANPKSYEATTLAEDEIGNNLSVERSTVKTKDGWIQVKGQVFDKTNNSKIPGVSVVIKGFLINTGTTTDADGNFSLDYYADENEKITLVFSFIGYITSEYTVALNKPVVEMKPISLPVDMTSLGGICIDPWYSPRRWWWGIKGLFTR